MNAKQQIKAEMNRFQVADELVSAALSLLGAVKATERKVPRLVLAAMPAFERAIEHWSEVSEAESAPNSVEP